MRPDEFDTCIGMLIDTFGKNHYPDLRRKALWAGLAHFPFEDLRDAVSSFLRDARSAPLYSDLRDACLNIARGKPRSAQSNLGGHDCDECGTNGVIEMIGYLNDQHTTTFAACDHCELGRRNGQGGVVMSRDKLHQRGWLVMRPRMNFESKVKKA